MVRCAAVGLLLEGWYRRLRDRGSTCHAEGMKRRLPKRSDRIVMWIIAIIVLLIVNFWLANRATQVQRVRVSYTPTFLAQVKAGNVSEITSRGTALQGDFRRPSARAARPASARKYP